MGELKCGVRCHLSTSFRKNLVEKKLFRMSGVAFRLVAKVESALIRFHHEDISHRVITTTVIRPLDDRTYLFGSVFTHLCSIDISVDLVSSRLAAI